MDQNRLVVLVDELVIRGLKRVAPAEVDLDEHGAIALRRDGVRQRGRGAAAQREQDGRTESVASAG